LIYVVLGMHKSGTTLVSQILHQSGVNMGEFDSKVSYDQGNKYERLETHDLNIELLGTAYAESSLNVSSPLREMARVPLRHLEKMKRFVETMKHFPPDWGFKDPRTCLTYSIWKTVLPEHRLICIFRDPAALWKHYQPKRFWNFPVTLERSWKSLTGWYVYNREMLRFIEETQDGYYLAKYGDFMQNEAEFKRLCAFIGRALKDCRDSKLFRNRPETSWLYKISIGLQKLFFQRDIPALYEKLEVLAARQAA